MSSAIEFSNLSANLTGQANFTIAADSITAPAAKDITIDSGNVNVRESSIFCLTPSLIQIRSFTLSVSDSSNARIGGSDATLFIADHQSTFTLSTIDQTDTSQIQIDNIDFKVWANDKNNPPPKLIFNFDTSNGPNFGKFIFSGKENANIFALHALFSLGYVYINKQQVTYNEKRFTVGDYTTGNLIISLTHGD